jgi:acyl-CoA synthetase (AMP-forming)/AMP-acid ligase II
MEGVRLGCDRDGCLEVRSHAVALGYWPEESPNLGEGRFRTSDLAEMQDGVVFLCGRASDLINVAGRKIAPETVERVLLTHPGVRECVVFGAPDTQGAREDRMVACIVPRERLSEEELRQFALARLPAWQTPRCWEFVDSLPVNSRGKLSRGQMQLWLRHRLETSTKAD